jgi:WD40 repeat protein
LGERQFTDGTTRPVGRDSEGRQKEWNAFMKTVLSHSLVTSFILAVGLVTNTNWRACGQDVAKFVNNTQLGQFEGSLPSRAISRIGTVRLRLDAEAEDCAFTEDGKTLISLSKQGTLYTWEVATGRKLSESSPVPKGESGRILSPDGRIFAAVRKGQNCRLIDVSSHEVIREILSSATLCAFFSGGKIFCNHFGQGSLKFITTATGQPFPVSGPRNQAGHALLEGAPTDTYLRSVDVSANGLLGMSYITGPVWLWDLKSGKLLRKLAGQGEDDKDENDYHTVVALSSDGKYLIAQNSHYRLFLFETASGKQLEILRGPGSPLHGFVADDSRTLIVWDACRVFRWDLDSRKIIGPSIGSASEIKCVALSKDGSLIAVGNANRTQMLFETKTGKRLHADPGPESPSTQARFLNDGKTIASLSGAVLCGPNEEVCYWDGRTGNRVELPDHRAWDLACLSADGTTTVHGNWKNVWVRFNGNIVSQVVNDLRDFRSLIPLAISPDGTVLVTAWQVKESPRGLVTKPDEQAIHVRQAGTGKEVRFLANYLAWHASFCFSPDNRTLLGWFEPWSTAVDHEGEFNGYPQGRPVHLWDTTSGKPLAGFSHNPTKVGAFAFSPTGRVLACTESSTKPVILLKEVFSGNTLDTIPRDPDFHCGLAFSPVNHILAFSHKTGDICLWDLAGNVSLGSLTGHRGRVISLDFSLDGRRLLSSGEDGTIITWDVADIRPKPPTKSPNVESGDLNFLWQALAGSDATKSYRAMLMLESTGSPAVELLDKHLSEDLESAPADVLALIRDLDSPLHSVREKATQELRAQGDSAQPAIRVALSRNPPPESKRRLQSLLSSSDSEHLASNQIRAIRAIEVLERINSIESSAILERLAKNSQYGRVSEEAKLSLARGLPGR